MKRTLLLLALALPSLAIGMGSQGALYAAAENFIKSASAWQRQCSGKSDSACARNLDAVRKIAFEAAEFTEELSKDETPHANDPNQDGVGENGVVNGWRAHWRMYSELFKYHGECFNRYDTPECRAKWAAQDKERTRLWRLYGPEPRWHDFPDALRHRTFKPGK